MATLHSPAVLVLDAWGVIYGLGDDVQLRLIPFIAESGGIRDSARITAVYREASLGHRTPEAFWEEVGLDRSHEDRYLARTQLTDGILPFLGEASGRFASIACLSNDVSQWSRKLRKTFGLERFIRTWVISGDVGYRKPGPEIYRVLMERLSVEPNRLLFVDDRPPNLDAAQAQGIRTVLYSSQRKPEAAAHQQVESLLDILRLA